MEVAGLSDAEHEATVEALNDRIQAEAWDHDTELLARCVDLLGSILAQLQAGILTAQPKKTTGFGRATYPPPVERPDWITGGEPAVDDVEVVTPGQLARMFLSS